jgi:23S rRNA (adenine2503-C2)-methyltransferase
MLGSDVSRKMQQNPPLLDAKTPHFASEKMLFGRDRRALAEALSGMGEPAYRAAQIAEAIYIQKLAEINEITTLPKALRAKLVAEGWSVGRPRIAQSFQSVDGTERYLIDVQGDESVEAVWMPEGDDSEEGDENETEKEWKRATICVSSQIGCAVGCRFCLTAKLGLKRNLTAGEIAGQVVEICSRHGVEFGRDRLNLVFMGMGEPFLNYDSFMAAVRLLVEECGVSPRRMTVSTSGVVPGIERFAQEPAEVRPKLAVSLNAPSGELRSELMPINAKWPIESVLKVLLQVKLRPHERITFEYVLLGGINDRHEDARRLAALLRRSGLPAKVNLIAWNEGPGVNYEAPENNTVEGFLQALIAEGIPAYLRRSRGRDIYAACGQLKKNIEPVE